MKLQGDSDFAPTALAAMSSEPFRTAWTNGMHERSADDENNSIQDTEMQEIVEDTHNADSEQAQQVNGVLPDSATNGDSHGERMNGVQTNGAHDDDTEKKLENGDGAQSPSGEDMSDTASQQTAHRMTTRARAHAASTPSPPLSPSAGIDAIHPLFAFATDSLPDRDFGLPPNEAEETRMLLMAYVQKQDEVARVTSDLHHGLLQADRMRQDVFKWAKAEAHVGEMSDGEDWYDNEEWGLEQDLMKGRDEEDDETAVAGKKSTRQRRKPDKEDR